jgi:hypothetical protein
MKHALTLAVLSLAAPAFAADHIITVPFDSVVATPAKNGERLDPTLFQFGPAVPGGADDMSHAQSNGFGKSKEDACRWALLGSFLKMQAKAKSTGKKVVGIRTYAGDTESAKSDCVCLAGAVVVRSTIKASYK